MHIKTSQSALLSNHELLLHLQKEKAEYDGSDGTGRERKVPGGLKYVLTDAIQYLSPAPVLDPDTDLESEPSHIANLTTTHPERPMTLYKGPHSLFRVLSPQYRLNKAEYLQIYNLRPRTTLELDLIVEESSTRFEEHQLEDMLAQIHAVFDEEEATIPKGVENQEMEKIENKLLGASKRKRVKRRAPA